MKGLWLLDPDLVYLNHGSFGSCPRPVLDVQTELRARMERDPMRFFLHDLEGLLDEARGAVAPRLGADPAGLVFVPNATYAISSVLSSVRLEPGDEVLVTDHGYNACTNAARRWTARAGARTVVATIPFPLSGPEDATRAVLSAVSARTRLALVDHVTSPTGLVLPIREIVAALGARGVDVLVDGAHAPGMLPLDLGAIGAAYYTGNFHKWVCAPKGAAFLHVRSDRRDGLHPAVTSHGANATRNDRSRLLLEFDWTGTDDPSAILSVPAAYAFLEALVPGGLAATMRDNRALALEARAILCDALTIAPPAPASMIGSLATVTLPDGPTAPPLGTDPLQAALYDRHRIHVPVFPGPSGGRLLRVSAQQYNTAADYRRLATALLSELDRERA